MRRTAYYSTISVIIFGLANLAVAQQPTTSRATGSPTLFDILQSRLQASGLAPPTEKPSAQTSVSNRQVATQEPRPAPKRVVTRNPRVLVETDVDAPGSAPLPEASSENPQSSSSAANRIHQRLSAFRNSQFGSSSRSSLDSTNESEREVSESPAEEDISRVSPGEVAGAPTLAPVEEPRVVGEALPGANLPQPRLATPSPKYAGDGSAIADSTPTPARSQVSIPRKRAVTNETVSSPQVLFTQQSPILNVKTVGPERIDVGREATFRVTIENLGSAPADELIVSIDFPQWADVLGAEVSTGATSSEVAVNGTRLFRWKVGRLGAKDVQTVALHVVARQSQPLNLAVNWQHAPVATAASIHVLQPELKLDLEGPEEVLFGEKQLYRLNLENTGSGDARGVSLSLLPVGTGQEKPAVQPIGDLASGQKKTIEVELTARNEGDLVIQVDATAEGNVRTHLAEKVRVLRPGLGVDVTAPEFQFVGQELTYRIVVSNPGTAKVDEVTIQAALPETVSYVSCTKEGLIADQDGAIRWGVEALAPQESRTLLVKCVAAAAGNGRLVVTSEAAGNLKASGEAGVQIDAIADLALEVIDPTGPVATGTETTYQIKIENRGSKAADNVEIVAYFSHGIEPLGAEGGNYQVGPGQVVFDMIPTIAAGQAKTFVVKARAESTGNHIIRAEVFCKPLGTRLVGEESTYFYGKRGTDPQDVAPPRPRSAEDGVLTADQRGAAPAETSERPKE
ncbi:MAG: DUF11 domain-containing protein [Planctomycetaceae bacterium]|nr:DUF11 domain-containing protein [Planctomycetaceae bacterium]